MKKKKVTKSKKAAKKKSANTSTSKSKKPKSKATRSKPRAKTRAKKKTAAKRRTKSTQRSAEKQVADSVPEPNKPARPGSRAQKRKHLSQRLKSLHRRAILIESELQRLEGRFYRVCIFGSARTQPDTPAYNRVFQLARLLAGEGIDILTGAGPGLMEAANKGAQLGREEQQTKALSYGISIQLPFEPDDNMHLDVKSHHLKFSSRLDEFMRLSNAIIITPGGIGTALEFFFAWQLIQVKHIETRPVVFLNRSFWSGLLEWVAKFPLEQKLISPGDMDYLQMVDTPEQAFEIISEHHEKFLKKRSMLEKLSKEL